MEREQIRLPDNPTAQFVLDGLIISVTHEKMKREQAIELFTEWFPDAEVLPSESE